MLTLARAARSRNGGALAETGAQVSEAGQEARSVCARERHEPEKEQQEQQQERDALEFTPPRQRTQRVLHAARAQCQQRHRRRLQQPPVRGGQRALGHLDTDADQTVAALCAPSPNENVLMNCTCQYVEYTVLEIVSKALIIKIFLL